MSLVKITVTISILFTLSVSYLTLKYKKSSPDLRILSYSSFISGSGSALSQIFEKKCNCSVEFINAGEGQMISRILKLRKNIDLVIGLDELTLFQTQKKFWKEVDVKVELASQVKIKEKRFVPYDWSPMGFVYRKNEIHPPRSWKELLSRKDLKLSLQDPRLSTPGIFFQYWIFSYSLNMGTFAAARRNIKTIHSKLRNITHSYSDSWSNSYNLFQKKITNMVFTYLSSLLYHWYEEKDKNYSFAIFKDHPVHIEYLAIPKTCNRCDLSQKFVNLIMSQKGQDILVHKNYMLPARKKSFLRIKGLPLPQIIKEDHLKEFLLKKDEIISSWKGSL